MNVCESHPSERGLHRAKQVWLGRCISRSGLGHVVALVLLLPCGELALPWLCDGKELPSRCLTVQRPTGRVCTGCRDPRRFRSLRSRSDRCQCRQAPGTVLGLGYLVYLIHERLDSSRVDELSDQRYYSMSLWAAAGKALQGPVLPWSRARPISSCVWLSSGGARNHLPR